MPAPASSFGDTSVNCQTTSPTGIRRTAAPLSTRYEDKVYLATVDAHVVALDAASGELVWDQPVEDHREGYYMTTAPIVAKGKIMVGVSGGEWGIRGFVVALDARTGEEAWKAHSIPSPDQPGGNSWPGDTWRTGGAPIWLPGTYDPDLNLTYWGTGNAGPWMGDQRTGDNLYTNSVIAVDADTGVLRGYHQYYWNGSWDWDEVDAPLLVNVRRDGRRIDALVHPGRNGYLWLLGRGADDISFIEAKPFVRQNVFTRLDPQTGRPEYDPERRPGTGQRASFCPSLWGGKNWPPAAYNPQTRYLYIPANENLCSYIEGREAEYEPGTRFIGASSQTFAREGADHFGELQAWDLDAGERVWVREFESPNWGPVLTTAGGLVFSGGTSDRYFRAFDAQCHTRQTRCTPYARRVEIEPLGDGHRGRHVRTPHYVGRLSGDGPVVRLRPVRVPRALRGLEGLHQQLADLGLQPTMVFVPGIRRAAL